MVTWPGRSADAHEERVAQERATLLFIEQFRNRNGNRSNESNGDEYGVPDGGQRYKAYTLGNFREIPQVQEHLSEDDVFAIEVVARVLPFKTNSYVVDELIDWDDVPNDPIFVLNFPRKDMLEPQHFDEMAALVRRGAPKSEIDALAARIRLNLNPHPAGQMEHNVPEINGTKLTGMQHKYRETVLFFPSNGQTCHAYCTFCFRWPQFVGMDELKFAMRETDLLVEYLRAHPEVSDVLFTGGDPMVMRTKNLERYIRPLLEADLPNLRTIRIGTKALGYWPYRFTTDEDADDVLSLFREVSGAGIHLAIMAHFNHGRELSTKAVEDAIRKIKSTGAEIRTQSPLMRGINDDPEVWSEMWRRQVDLGCIPYYMFIARDTGAQDYFAVPLVRAWEIFREAYSSVSGVCRTVRGPSMSADPGKVQVLGVSEMNGRKVLTLRMLQGRDPDWAMRPFFAEYDPSAIWLSDLRPAFGEREFFWERELQDAYAADTREPAGIT
ncbi:MAG TPA: lysine 2,3-aminomutase [Dehalococcoidia bacterium]